MKLPKMVFPPAPNWAPLSKTGLPVREYMFMGIVSFGGIICLRRGI